MNPRKTITICGKQADMLYCAAAETGYERLTGKSSAIFSPTRQTDNNGQPVTDDDGNPVFQMPAATPEDYITLAVCAIVAAYGRRDEEAPIDLETILYDASPQEVASIITTVVQLRNQWYQVPNIVKPDMQDDQDNAGSEKNA